MINHHQNHSLKSLKKRAKHETHELSKRNVHMPSHKDIEQSRGMLEHSSKFSSRQKRAIPSTCQHSKYVGRSNQLRRLHTYCQQFGSVHIFF